MNRKVFVRKKLSGCFVLTALLLGLAACGSSGGKMEEYSAKQVYKDSSGQEGTNKIFVSRDKIRMEMRSPKGEGSMVMIFRKDKKVAWTLFPEEKFYFENKLDEAKLQKAFGEIQDDVKKEELGIETVSGLKCRKMRVETTSSFMGRQIKTTSTVWVSDRLDFPVKIQSEEGGVVEMRDIKSGRQPSDLFEIPAGYTKRKMPLFGMK
jgi:hypothetical protein